MRVVWFAGCLLALAACKDGTSGDDFPTDPGGGGGGGAGGGGGGADAGLIDATADAANAPLSGRVCLLRDFRNVRDCEPTGAQGLLVTLGNQSAITAADGTFDIPQPTSMDPVWRVSGMAGAKEVITSLVPYGPEVTHLPVVTKADYDALTAANATEIMESFEGSIHARVVRNDVPVSDAVAVTSDGSAQYAARYDSLLGETTWETDATGPQGAVWLPGPDAGARTIRFSHMSTSKTETIPVEANAITYVTIAL